MADKLEKIYFIVYDIADSKRWRKVYKLMQGYGEWVQLSVFQCRLTKMRYIELLAKCQVLIDHDEDHVVIIEVGTSASLKPKIISLGKRSLVPVEREVKIV